MPEARNKALLIAFFCFVASSSMATPPSGAEVKVETVKWFQKTEQALMDAVGTGGKETWDAVMDPDCVITM